MRSVPHHLASFLRAALERTRWSILVIDDSSIHVSDSHVNTSFDMSVVKALDVKDMVES